MSQSDSMFYRLTTGRKRFKAFLFALLAFCILAVSITFFALSVSKPYMGIDLSMNDQGWAVERVHASGLASQVGIKARHSLYRFQ